MKIENDKCKHGIEKKWCATCLKDQEITHNLPRSHTRRKKVVETKTPPVPLTRPLPSLSDKLNIHFDESSTMLARQYLVEATDEFIKSPTYTNIPALEGEILLLMDSIHLFSSIDALVRIIGIDEGYNPADVFTEAKEIVINNMDYDFLAKLFFYSGRSANDIQCVFWLLFLFLMQQATQKEFRRRVEWSNSMEVLQYFMKQDKTSIDKLLDKIAVIIRASLKTMKVSVEKNPSKKKLLKSLTLTTEEIGNTVGQLNIQESDRKVSLYSISSMQSLEEKRQTVILNIHEYYKELMDKIIIGNTDLPLGPVSELKGVNNIQWNSYCKDLLRDYLQIAIKEATPFIQGPGKDEGMNLFSLATEVYNKHWNMERGKNSEAKRKTYLKSEDEPAPTTREQLSGILMWKRKEVDQEDIKEWEANFETGECKRVERPLKDWLKEEEFTEQMMIHIALDRFCKEYKKRGKELKEGFYLLWGGRTYKQITEQTGIPERTLSYCVMRFAEILRKNQEKDNQKIHTIIKSLQK